MSDLISAVADWPQDGRKADAAKYFYERADFKRLLDGSSFMVIGPKGSGKSSLINYIERNCDGQTSFCHQLDARDLSLRKLADIASDPNEIEGFWRELIVMSALTVINSLILRNQDFSEALPVTSSVGELAMHLRQFDISFSHADAKLEHAKATPWQDRAYITKRFLNKLASSLNKPISFYLPIDRLDIAFRSDLTDAERRSYLNILSGLVNAAQAMTEEIAQGGKILIRPIVLLRSDILAQVPSTDRTKRADMTIQLFWHPGEAQKMLAKRISVDTGLPSNDFRSNWQSLFDPFKNGRISDNYDNGKEKSPFDWVEFRTYWRPRDYVVFLQTCASMTRDRGFAKVQFDQFVASERHFANYIIQHTVDEGEPQMPNIQQRFAQLAQMIRSRSTLARNFTLIEIAQAFGIDDEAAKEVLRFLFSLGAVGHTTANYNVNYPNTRYVFSFKQQAHATIDNASEVVLHPSIWRALS